MPAMLTVVNEEEEGAEPDDYLFDENRVTIGRGQDNDLTLSDPKRIVSTEHAMIEQAGETYQLIDRGSKNFTYVRDQRVTAQEPYELSDGEVFWIGDFRIEFHLVDTAPAASDTEGEETVFDETFQNPFEEPTAQLIDALEALTDAYEEEAPQRRDDALADAVRTEAPRPAVQEAVDRACDELGIRPPGGSPANRGGSGSEDPADAPTRNGGCSLASTDTGGTKAEGTDPTKTEPVLDTLAEALAEVLPIPWRFRHEFIGQTIMQAPETQFLYEGDGTTIKQHLTDPSISAEERNQRLEYVAEAAESLAVHQVAMLNGYKASVMKGAEELLAQLDPDAHREALIETTSIFEYLPILASPAIVDRMQAEWEELKKGDWSAAEQRIFRPAFTKAYLARMTAPRTDDDEADTS